jgi:hypothetical protein
LPTSVFTLPVVLYSPIVRARTQRCGARVCRWHLCAALAIVR